MGNFGVFFVCRAEAREDVREREKGKGSEGVCMCDISGMKQSEGGLNTNDPTSGHFWNVAVSLAWPIVLETSYGPICLGLRSFLAVVKDSNLAYLAREECESG